MDPTAERPLASLLAAVARGLDRLGFTPNTLTIVGFLGSALAAVILAAGYPLIACIIFLLSSAVDMLDGTLARIQGRITRFGALLDSTLDRYAEAALLSALAYHKYASSELGAPLLVAILACLVGSLMVSYIRARAEGLGLSGKTGIFQRPERVVALSAALAFPTLTLPLLVALGIGTHVTVAQRLVYVWRQSCGNSVK
jgi:CDP-diacylglycerol--glycerol-3-phosphate 3-phosphatidyltransferase